MLFDLPDDIFNYLFSKLPVNSILRCRCVSKRCRRLLSHPEFVKIHLHHSLLRQKFLLRSNRDDSYYFLDYEPNEGNCDTLHRKFPFESSHYARILGSCNDLLCVSVDVDQFRRGHSKNCKIVLWNPSIGDFKILPDSTPLIETSDHTNNGDFTNEYHCLGFGYDTFSRDFKFLRVIFRPRYQVDVYSLKADSWKVIENTPVTRFGFSLTIAGIGINGYIYWVVDRKRGNLDRWIVGFDLKEEKFIELQFPPLHPNRGYWLVELRELGGNLGVYYSYWNRNDLFVELWMMNEDKEWTKLAKISCNGGGPILNYILSKMLLCVYSDGKLLFYSNKYNSERGYIVSAYDPEAKSIVETFHLNGVSISGCLMIYNESLVSPNAWKA